MQPPRNGSRTRSLLVQQGWAGVGNGAYAWNACCSYPQDPTGGLPAAAPLPLTAQRAGAVGLNHYCQLVNEGMACFYKANGTKVTGFPKFISSVWSGSVALHVAVAALSCTARFPDRCATDDSGDPQIRYDAVAERWIISQFAISVSPYLQCVAGR